MQLPKILSAIAVWLCLPNVAFAQECIDTDGDGWGWNGTRSCLIEQQIEQQISDCVDTDGDGWGWNGTRSCLIGASSDSASSTGTSNQSTNQATNDASACVDTDGDGWGWGPNGSCKMPSLQQPAQQPSQNAVTVSEPTAGLPAGQYNRNRDLIALHFDHAPDPDDGHAAAAAFVIQDTYGLAVQVVGGTYGVYSADRYVYRSESLMRQIWGNQWLDAHNSRSASVQQAAQRWVGIMAAGGDVWVAEGGPSDFTAAVVRQVRQQYPEFNTRNRVHVVQHSVWNEDHALREDLNFVRSNTDYIRIQDGNEPNATADFRQGSDFFVQQALSSSYANVWRAAFDYLPPSEKLDFSDTVELLHIINIGTGSIKSVDDFARSFLSQ